MTIETKELVISEELKRKVEMIFTFLFSLNSLVAILSSSSTKTHYGALTIHVCEIKTIRFD